MAEQVEALMKASVLMRNPQRVRDTIASLRSGGVDKLQVISDFDMTLSRFGFRGRRCPTSHNILDTSKVVSEVCQQQLKDLLHFYYPIEIDPNRTVDEKLPLMVDWWTKAHGLLCQQKIQQCQLAQIVRDSDVMLREGFETFFNTLHLSHVPLFIFSAGVGDIVEEITRQAGVLHPNVQVVSNFMDFDEDGILWRFKDPLIHTYNKNSSVLEGSSAQLQARPNVILLGDSMGDLTMADSVPGLSILLKIGFLNDKVEEQRERYLDAYDIVLEKDETLDVVIGILQHILPGNRPSPRGPAGEAVPPSEGPL
ncbi:7-methylguanosine phosphate-specific 5'-nucleotidase isoform X1 [Ornithorhynchus anatinus]|uniref:7-methylguanosine phosphate-specific 5'-nucleotidase isoform X1 n=1 Tax=Ornithorhynchus anatinus TaxID=9258 RepID=UPI0010A88C09|nr:7-methylguanosine phosphate-specific 5'-nucleotidase isoform X1 [Ornithorhynchus anatinus]